MRCERCSKKFREELGLVKKNRNYTERFKNKIIQEVIASDIKNVAQRKRSIVGMKYSRILSFGRMAQCSGSAIEEQY